VGVTCYTCHRGNAVPVYKWAVPAGTPNPNSILGNHEGRGLPDANDGFTTLSANSFTDYLNGNGEQIRVAGDTALPSPDHVVSIKVAEKTYGLMMHISSSLGVNCTYCHNTQSFRAWNMSRPQRVTAYYGIRMVRDINGTYISSLQSVFPDYRKGPHGDPYKVNCMTCHQGQNKPLGGASLTAQAPALLGPTLAPVPVAAPAAVAPAVPVAFNAPPAMTITK
jgi:photosynthetic reaction center cytochrome c subunit